MNGNSGEFPDGANDSDLCVAWRAKFLTTGDWQTINLEFREFEPVFRGRMVADAGPLNPGDIRQIGLMLVDKQAGPFRSAV